MSDEDQEGREETPAIKELREYGDRWKVKAEELAAKNAELTAQMRRSVITSAGVTHEYLVEGALALAERDGIDDPDDLANLARVMVAQARGELER